MDNYDRLHTAITNKDSSVVDLSSCGFDPVDAGILAARLFILVKNITTILLNDNKIEDQQVVFLAEALKEHKNVTLVDFSNNPFSDRGKYALRKLKEVRPEMTILGVDRLEEMSSEARIKIWAQKSGRPIGKATQLVKEEPSPTGNGYDR